jgi:hypothetical protein
MKPCFCEKCGSNYVLTERTVDDDIIAILCMSCGHRQVLDVVFDEQLNDVWDQIKQEIQEDQQVVGPKFTYI